MASVRTRRSPRAVFDAVYRAEPANVAHVRHEVADVASMCGADDATLSKIKLAVSEAASNVVLHAYRDSLAVGDIHVLVERSEDCLKVFVGDDGIGMSPRIDSPGVGLGLSLMANLADRCAINLTRAGGTEIILQFEMAA